MDDFNYRNKFPRGSEVHLPPWFLKICVYVFLFLCCYFLINATIDNRLESLGLKPLEAKIANPKAQTGGVDNLTEAPAPFGTPVKLRDAR